MPSGENLREHTCHGQFIERVGTVTPVGADGYVIVPVRKFTSGSVVPEFDTILNPDGAAADGNAYPAGNDVLEVGEILLQRVVVLG